MKPKPSAFKPVSYVTVPHVVKPSAVTVPAEVKSSQEAEMRSPQTPESMDIGEVSTCILVMGEVCHIVLAIH